MQSASDTATMQTPKEPTRDSISIGDRLLTLARNAAEGPLVFADITRRVVAGRDVIDRVLHYISTPTTGEPSPGTSLRQPRVIAPMQLVVDPAGEQIPFVIDEIERSRDPVIPLLETANLRGRVIPKQRQVPLPGHPGTTVTLSEPVIYFTFTSAISAEENLEDFSMFVLSQRTLIPCLR